MNYSCTTASPGLRALSSAVIAAVCSGVALAAQFKTLALRQVPTGMAVSENGEFLFVPHREANAVSIVETRTNSTVAFVSCPAPKSLLYRGRKLFVANFGKGTISVLSADRNWELTDELLAGAQDVYDLSAPCEAKFEGTILVTAGRYTDHRVLVVDTKSDKSREVRKGTYISFASISSDGSTVIQQGELNHSPTATPETFDAKAYLSGERAMSSRGEHEDTPILYQVPHSAFWFGARSLYAGTPPKRFGLEMGSLLIPDSARECFYVVGSNSVAIHRLDPSTEKLGEVPLDVPFPAYRWMREIWPDYTFHRPAAVTHGSDTTLYAYVPDKKAILTYKFNAPMNIPVAKATGTGAVTGGQPDAFPARVVVGKPVSVRLSSGATTGRYDVVTGPEGIAISPTGVLAWTPSARDVGSQQLKIRCSVGGAVSFLRFTTEVVTADIASKVSGDLAKLDQLGTHYLTGDRYDLQPTADWKGLLLMVDRTLSLLDEDGIVATRVLSLEAPCSAIRERGDSFIGLGNKELVFMDKKTGKAVRRVELPGAPLDIALHPSEPFSFVSCQQEGGEGSRGFASRRILFVDETKGRVVAMPRAVGHWLVMDPDGSARKGHTSRRNRGTAETLGMGGTECVDRPDVGSFGKRGARRNEHLLCSIWVLGSI